MLCFTCRQTARIDGKTVKNRFLTRYLSEHIISISDGLKCLSQEELLGECISEGN